MVKEYCSLRQDECLLEGGENERARSEDSEQRESYTTQRKERQNAAWLTKAIFVGFLLLSLIQNGILYHQKSILAEKVTMGISKYTGLPTNIPTVYTFRTDYFNNNLTLENEMWDNLNLDASVVALDPVYVAEHKLEKSSPFPWDTEREVYFLKAFHSLHCLKYMRKAFMDLQAGNEAVIPPDHVYHCIDSLRQDIMCKADDTPMPSPRILNSVGDQQVLQCRDFSKVVEWATAPERNACYRAGNDFRPVIHNLDRHAYCHVDSPWYHVAKEYFEKHGHRNPWGDDEKKQK